MKKIIIGLVLAVVLTSTPQTASASIWSDFVNWIRTSPKSVVEDPTTAVIFSLSTERAAPGERIVVKGMNLTAEHLVAIKNGDSTVVSINSVESSPEALVFVVPQIEKGSYSVVVYKLRRNESNPLTLEIVGDSTNTPTTEVTAVCPSGYICTPGTPTSPQSTICPAGYICEKAPTSNQVTWKGDCYVFAQDIEIGEAGGKVEELQKFLIKAGFYGSPEGDQRGVFGKSTKQAVELYQISAGLPVTGYVGPITRAKMNGSCKGTTSTQTGGSGIHLAVSGGEISDGAYLTYLSFTGSSSNRPVREWSLHFSCPSKVDVSTVPGADCNDSFKMSSYQNSGNVIRKEFYFRNYTSLHQGVIATLTGYDESGKVIGTSKQRISIPPTSTGPMTWSKVKVFSPNGGETLNPGQKVAVKWSTQSDSTFVFKPTSKTVIYILKDRSVVSTYNTVNSGSYEIVVPSTLAPASNYKISVTVYAEAPAPQGSAMGDESDTPFAISANTVPTSDATIKLVSPNGGETFSSNKIRVTWRVSGTVAMTDRVHLIAQYSNGAKIYMGSTLALNQYFDWTLDKNYSGKYKIIIADDAAGVDVFDTSDNYFAISLSTHSPSPSPTYSIEPTSSPDQTTSYPVINNHPTPRVVYPNGGESFQQGNSINIKWYGGGNGEKYRVEVYDGGSKVATPISDITPSSNSAYYDGTILWNIPSTMVGRYIYKIRIVRLSDGAIVDESDSSFGVTSVPQSINVVSPKAGVTWYVSKPYEIVWGSDIKSSSVKVYLSGGGNEEGYKKLIASINNNGYYTFTPTANDTSRSGYTWKVMVCDATDTVCGLSGEIKIQYEPSPGYTNSPSGSPVSSSSRNSGLLGAVFYAIGDLLDGTTAW